MVLSAFKHRRDCKHYKVSCWPNLQRFLALAIVSDVIRLGLLILLALYAYSSYLQIAIVVVEQHLPTLQFVVFAIAFALINSFLI